MHKKTYLKLMAVVLCTVLFFVLAVGCGSQKATGNDTTAAVSESAATSAATSQASSEPVKLVYWNIGDTFKRSDDTGKYSKEELVFNKTQEQFEKDNPNIKVEVVDQTYDNIPNLFKAAGLAKNGPDVSLIWAGSFTNDFKDFILPLDEYFSAEELSKFPDLSLCRTNFKKDGALLAIPTESSTLNLFYNKELFKKAGIDENSSPATWNDLLEICKKLKTANITPMVVGDKEGYFSAWVIGEFLSDLYGTEGIFKFLDGQAKATDPEFKKAMQQWADFFNYDYVNKDYYSLSNADAGNKFINGEAAMRFSGSWDTGAINEALGEKAGTFMIPSISSDAPFAGYLCSQFGNNLVVTNYSSHPKEAAMFIKALTSADFQALRYQQFGDLPARLDVNISTDAKNPLATKSYSWIQNNKNVVGFDSIMASDACQEFYRLAPVVIGKKMSVDDMLKSVQEKFDAALKK